MSEDGKGHKKKSLKLSFKGDKKEKKKKSSSSSHHHDGSDRKGKRKAEEESDVEDVGGDEQAWVPAESVLDVNGPAFIYQELALSTDPSGSSKTPFAIQYNPTLQSITPTSVLPPSLGDQNAFLPESDELGGGAMIAAIETTPTSVHQVWVSVRVAGSESYTFRSAEGRFLGTTDRHGSVNATSEARGPMECWTLEQVPGTSGIAIKSATGGYLTLDEVAGGKVVLRADGESAEACLWQVKLQWKYRHQARKEHGGPQLTASGMKRTFDPSSTLGTDLEKLNRSRMGLTAGKYVHVSDRGLDKARKEGRLASELLDRRTQLKSDRYAK